MCERRDEVETRSECGKESVEVRTKPVHSHPLTWVGSIACDSNLAIPRQEVAKEGRIAVACRRRRVSLASAEETGVDHSPCSMFSQIARVPVGKARIAAMERMESFIVQKDGEV